MNTSQAPITVPVAAQVPPQTWWESLQSYMHDVLDRLKISSHDLMQLIAFFVIGFCAGFLLKKYVRYFFIITILFVLIVLIFNRFEIILINWTHVRQLTGIDSSMTLQQCFEQLALIVRDNLLLTISTLVGFMLGFRIG